MLAFGVVITRREFSAIAGALAATGAVQPAIGPAAVPVMEQVFWVEFDARPEDAAGWTVEPPAGIALLDRTRPGPNRTRTRFYFRAARGMARTEIRFRAPAGVTAVPLRVLSYREDIEDKSRTLPGFTGDVRKAGRSYHTDRMLAEARANLAAFPDLRERLAQPTRYDGLDDDALWRALPSWSVPRQLYSNWPCPHCGEAIYRVNSFYPWRAHGQYRCECPLCKRVYPSNDFAADDFTSGDHPDDGLGWDSTGTGAFDDQHRWVAYAVELAWRGSGVQMWKMALRHVLAGDREAAHRASLLLARLAYVYPGMEGDRQPRFKLRRPYKISLEMQFESSLITVPALLAYDLLWEYIADDGRLVEFLRAKDPSVRSGSDVRRLIDVYFAQHLALNFLRRWYHGDNGKWETQLVRVALAANMGEASNRWITEVFTHAYNSAANEGGFQDSVLTNYMTREGPTNIGSFHYTRLSLEYLQETAKCLERYPDPKWRAACDLFDERRHPRVRAMGEAYLDMKVAGQFFPNYGDAGDARTYRVGVVEPYRDFFLNYYRHWPSDRLARELARLRDRRPELAQVDRGNTPEVFDRSIWPEVEAHARRAGAEPPAHSRVLDGVGMAFLESRAADPDLNRRAGLALRYGYGWGHAHNDNLNVQYWAKGMCVVPELGYPNWVHPLGSTTGTAHHITGMIDGREQYNGSKGRGSLELFADAPEAAFVSCSAPPVGVRSVCLADAPGGNSYVFDVLRMTGGNTRTYCFHGPSGEAWECALPFGDSGPAIFGNLMEPRRAASGADVVAAWTAGDAPVKLRLRMLGRAGRIYTTAKFGKVDSPPVRFLLAEDTAPGGASEFVALWEPHEGAAFIDKVERAADGCVTVTMAGGRVDTFLYGGEVRAGGFEFRGSFGYVSMDGGKLRCLHLVNGSRLLAGGAGVRETAPEFRARIAAVDLERRIVKFDRALPAEADIAGRQMNITAGGRHRTSYCIARVAGPDTVEVDLSAKIFQSRFMAADAAQRTVTCEIAPPVEAVRRFPSGYYDGALLTGENLQARYRVVRVDGKTIHLDRAPDPADFRTPDAFGRPMVHIFDYGEGDEVSIAGSVFMRRADGGGWERRAAFATKLEGL